MEVLPCTAQSFARRPSPRYFGFAQAQGKIVRHWQALATSEGGIWPFDPWLRTIAHYQVGFPQKESSIPWKFASHSGRVGSDRRERYQRLVSCLWSTTVQVSCYGQTMNIFFAFQFPTDRRDV